MIVFVLFVTALVFGILALAGVPARISWSGAGVVALAAAGLVARLAGS